MTMAMMMAGGSGGGGDGGVALLLCICVTLKITTAAKITTKPNNCRAVAIYLPRYLIHFDSIRR